VWSAVLLWPGPAPLSLLAVLVVVVAMGVPGSMIGFDYARTSNPFHRLGGATGMTNVMGFTATILFVLAVGVLLDLQGAGTPDTYSLGAFKVAFAVQLPLWAIGVVGILVSRRQTRALMAREGVFVPRMRETLPRMRETLPRMRQARRARLSRRADLSREKQG
ncbi:MAG: hypothetical protein ACRYF3_04230, partial [Janthinobacterium lividum]